MLISAGGRCSVVGLGNRRNRRHGLATNRHPFSRLLLLLLLLLSLLLSSFLQGMTMSAVKSAKHANAKCILVFTRHGGSARLVAQSCPDVPILAFCTSPKVCRQLTVHRGVWPVHTDNLPRAKREIQVRQEAREAVVASRESQVASRSRHSGPRRSGPRHPSLATLCSPPFARHRLLVTVCSSPFARRTSLSSQVGSSPSSPVVHFPALLPPLPGKRCALTQLPTHPPSVFSFCLLSPSVLQGIEYAKRMGFCDSGDAVIVCQYEEPNGTLEGNVSVRTSLIV